MDVETQRELDEYIDTIDTFMAIGDFIERVLCSPWLWIALPWIVLRGLRVGRRLLEML